MNRRSLILSAGFWWVLTGCQDAEVDQAAEVDPSDIVWADSVFIEEAGVKKGQDVIFLPTPPMVVDKMIEISEIKASDLVYDLGTGDGRLAIAAAKRTGCKAVGYEIDPELVKAARENVRRNGVEHLVTIEQQDILTLDLSPANVVMMFLNPELNVRLIPQLEKLQPGARVVSHDFDMQGKIEPDLVIENFRSDVPDFINLHNIYLWKAPLRARQ